LRLETMIENEKEALIEAEKLRRVAFAGITIRLG
jgi:hypothetical protein